MSSSAIGQGAGGEIQLTDGIARLLQREAVYAHRFSGRRFDCGNKLGYLQATVELSLAHPALGREFRSLPQAGRRPRSWTESALALSAARDAGSHCARHGFRAQAADCKLLTARSRRRSQPAATFKKPACTADSLAGPFGYR